MKPEIAATFNDRVFEGGLTYNGHPISLAAAIANIQVIREDHLVEKSKNTGTALSEMLAELVERHPSVGEVRSIGLFGAIELVKNKKTREPAAPFGGSSPEMTALKKFLLDHGVFLYTHCEEELAEGIQIIDQGLAITDKLAAV
jgi:taurine--2-oxoglutarate transaminase